MFVCALHRLYGPEFFTTVLLGVFNKFKTSESSVERKNLLNAVVHFYLFQSVSAKLLMGIVRHLLESCTEADIEILIFLMHNIGL